MDNIDPTRLLLLHEIVRQCQFAIKSKSDMDSAHEAIKQLMGTLDSDNYLVEMRQLQHHRYQLAYAQQGLLVALGILSRCLGWHRDVASKQDRADLRSELGINEDCVLKARDVRDAFEHIDERIEAATGRSPFLLDSNITLGKSRGLSPGVTAVRHLDLDSQTVLAQDKKGVAVSLDYAASIEEARRINRRAQELLRETMTPEWMKQLPEDMRPEPIMELSEWGEELV